MSVETTAYFVVAEALTNVGKHARASRASVGVRIVGEQLEIEVLDDGVGGADASAGVGPARARRPRQRAPRARSTSRARPGAGRASTRASR